MNMNGDVGVKHTSAGDVGVKHTSAGDVGVKHTSVVMLLNSIRD